MTESGYLGFMESIRRTRYGVRLLRIMDKLIVLVTFVSYGLFLLCLFLGNNKELVPAILVPAVSFLILTAIRSRINAPRPYEVYGFEPVIEKDTMGRSFPSRHVFSIFCIAGVMFLNDAFVAMPMFLLGVLLAILRVLGGVHFIKDVVAGALCGILFALVGDYLMGFVPYFGTM